MGRGKCGEIDFSAGFQLLFRVYFFFFLPLTLVYRLLFCMDIFFFFLIYSYCPNDHFHPPSAPGSGPMFRSTTVAVNPVSQTRRENNWVDMYKGSSALETSEPSFFCSFSFSFFFSSAAK